jgi:hypothetical protein
MWSVVRQFVEPDAQLRLTVAISIVALECLVAIWATVSRRHWFWRVAAVWGGVMLMVPIRAWEPAWLFGLSSPLIVVLIRCGQSIDHRFSKAAHPPDANGARYRFSLRDLLLLMLAVGMWLPSLLDVVRHWQPTNWLGWLVSSVSVAVLAAGAFACTRMPQKWRFAALLACGLVEVLGALWLEYPVLSTIAGAAGLTAYFYAFDRRHWLAMLLLALALPTCAGAMVWAGPWMRWQWVIAVAPNSAFVTLLLLEGALVVSIAAAVMLASVVAQQNLAAAWRLTAAIAGLVFAAAMLLPPGKVYWSMLAQTPRELPIAKFEAPENHYDEIRELAKQVVALDPNPITYAPVPGSSPIWYRDEVWRSTPATPKLEALYSDALRLLDAPNAVPFNPATDATAAYDRLKGSDIQLWRALCLSLQAETKLAAGSGDSNRAADFAIAVIRLSDMLGRGGLNVDSLVSLGLRRVGYQELQEMAHHLSRQKLQEVQQALENSIAEREYSAARWARNADFNERVYGWHMRLENVQHFGMDPDSEIRAEAMHLQLDLMINLLLQAELAIRRFKIDEGRLPSDLSELVPHYATAIPTDCYSQPLRYRVEADGFVLYSIGWDQRDDGGRFSTFNHYISTYAATTARSVPPGWQPLDFDLATLTRKPPADQPLPEAGGAPAQWPMAEK